MKLLSLLSFIILFGMIIGGIAVAIASMLEIWSALNGCYL